MSNLAALRALIGRPYAPGGDGPDAFDCYGLAVAVLQLLGGEQLPARGIVTLAARRRWVRLSEPRHGSLVAMGVGGLDRHVGVYLAEGGVMHAMERVGVVFDHLDTLRLRGFSDLRFYGAR